MDRKPLLTVKESAAILRIDPDEIELCLKKHTCGR